MFYFVDTSCENKNGSSFKRSREFEKMLAKQKIRPQIPAKPAGLRKSRPSSSGTEIHYRTEQNNLNNQQEMVKFLCFQIQKC